MKSSAHRNSGPKTLNVRGRLVDLSTPAVMGILNITPDSFFSGSRFTTESEILKQTEKMLLEGATFIDVGGYSSRPGAEDISIDEELKRILPAISSIIKEFPQALISIDTFRGEVARQAVKEGAAIVNDISAGELDTKMFETVAALNVPYIAMHMRGTPQTMNTLTDYTDVMKDVLNYFINKVSQLRALGITDIIIDPGFGFAKTIDQNFQLLNQLELLNKLDRPLLAGLSRKSMIWKTLNIPAEEALNGTTALNMTALLKGASILRVHDVKEAVQIIKLSGKLTAA